jgi:hypothetical protein
MRAGPYFLMFRKVLRAFFQCHWQWYYYYFLCFGLYPSSTLLSRKYLTTLKVTAFVRTDLSSSSGRKENVWFDRRMNTSSHIAFVNCVHFLQIMLVCMYLQYSLPDFSVSSSLSFIRFGSPFTAVVYF